VIHAYRGVVPKVHPSAWIVESADVIGDVELVEESSVWSARIYMSLAADYRAAQAT
jgi:carbonic anhydrase/acetyltransferase-like protein (isoleucine patch superfamily)